MTTKVVGSLGGLDAVAPDARVLAVASGRESIGSTKPRVRTARADRKDLPVRWAAASWQRVPVAERFCRWQELQYVAVYVSRSQPPPSDFAKSTMDSCASRAAAMRSVSAASSWRCASMHLEERRAARVVAQHRDLVRPSRAGRAGRFRRRARRATRDWRPARRAPRGTRSAPSARTAPSVSSRRAFASSTCDSIAFSASSGCTRPRPKRPDRRGRREETRQRGRFEAVRAGQRRATGSSRRAPAGCADRTRPASASARRMSGRRSMRPDGSPAGSCGTSVTSSIDAPRATSGVNTSRGERPVSVAIARLRAGRSPALARAMSATTAERSASAVRKSYSPMMPPSKRSRCRRDRVRAQLQRVLQDTTSSRIGGAQPEVRARDVAGDRDAHGLAVVVRRDEVVGPRREAPLRYLPHTSSS